MSSAGHFVPGRCRATNLCTYCAKLSAVETSEMLALDAMVNAPALYMVLTTRSPSHNAADFYRSREKLWKATRLRWSDAEYACVLEWTTGRSSRSRGRRYLHWNWLIKNVPATDTAIAEVRAMIAAIWCARKDAEPQAQYVGSVEDGGGLMRYLALHFHKESQSPPSGWGGQRFTYSRHRGERPGYFGQPGWKVRAAAHDALAFKRQLHRAGREVDDAYEAELLARQRHELARRLRWDCVVISIASETGVISRARKLDGSEPTVMRRATRAR